MYPVTPVWSNFEFPIATKTKTKTLQDFKNNFSSFGSDVLLSYTSKS